MILTSQGAASSLDLRITAVFVTMVSSVCGMFVPLYLSKWGTRAVVLESDVFRLLRSLSSGVILSVGMCHTVRVPLPTAQPAGAHTRLARGCQLPAVPC